MYYCNIVIVQKGTYMKEKEKLIKELYEKLVTQKEAAEILGVSQSALCNTIARDNNFPQPVSHSLYKVNDIVAYGINKGKLPENTYVIPVTHSKAKTIILCGRVSAGKTFINSSFIEDKDCVNYRKIMCGNTDTTFCTVEHQVCSKLQGEAFLRFYIDVEGLQPKEDNDKQYILETAKVINGTRVGLDDQEATEKIRLFKWIVDEIKKYFTEKDEKHITNKNQYKYAIYIYCRPNRECIDMMKQMGVERLEIIDTPGVSDTVEFSKNLNAKADFYLFTLRDDSQSEEKNSFKSLLEAVKDYISNGKTIFLYRATEPIYDEDDYNESANSSKSAVARFDNLFEDLIKNSVISTEISIFHPTEHYCLIPPMKKEKVIEIEKIFRKKLFQSMLNTSEDGHELENIAEIARNNSEAMKLIKKIIINCPIYDIPTNDNSSNVDVIEAYWKKDHERVLTGDRYRIYWDVNSCHNRLKYSLNKHFLSYTIENYKEEWQQQIIKNVYKVIMNGIDKDFGLGVGIHPFEGKEITMWASESVIADVLVDLADNNQLNRHSYIESLKNKLCISSSTWNYVYCKQDFAESLQKLRLINDYLIKIHVYDEEQLIGIRYVEGLAIYAKYRILESAGFKDDEIANIFNNIY